MTNGPDETLVDGPTAAQQAFCDRFVDGLVTILGDDLHSAYLYGAMLFPRPPGWRVDVDHHVVVASAPGPDVRDRIRGLHDALARADHLGTELDGYYLTLAAARGRADPHDLVWPHSPVDHAWALHRSHVHAGAFRLLHGADPRTFLPPAGWSECVAALDSELRFVAEHPEHPQFGILNLCRLVRTWRTRSVVASKYDSARWALRTLDERWHPAIDAALRDYQGILREGDTALLDSACPELLAEVTAEIADLRRTHSTS